MRTIGTFALTLGLALAMGAPGVSAQAHRTVVVTTSAKKGPKYCQTGEGHPKYGQQWCIDHGFALGTRAEWERTSGYGTVTVQVPAKRTVTVVEAPQIQTMVGPRAWARMEADAHRMGYNNGLTGHWLFMRNGDRTLRVTAGNEAFAELVFNKNGHMEHAYYWK